MNYGYPYGVMGPLPSQPLPALPGPGEPIRRPPPQPGKWFNPQKEQFYNLPTRAQQDMVVAANQAMNRAIEQLISAGVMPRWILQTANRFVAMSSGLGPFGFGTEPPIMTVWDDSQPSTMSPEEEASAWEYWQR